MFFDQLFQRFFRFPDPLVRFGGKDGGRFEKLAQLGDDGHFTAGPVARIDAHDDMSRQRCLH